MSSIRTNAAAAMLGVSANTLRSWERRFGHPAPRRTEGGHRLFELADIEALRQALERTGEVASAIEFARELGEGPASATRLRLALGKFDEQRADRVLEESLAVRSLERTVESVLLEAVEMLQRGSPERGFAQRYAIGWLAAAKRVAPPASRQQGVMIFDASAPGGLDALHVQSLELFMRRVGLRTLALPVELHQERIGSALRALRPCALVLAGAGIALPTLARLVYTARQVCGQLEVFDYMDAMPQTGASTVPRLAPSPSAAVQTLREAIDDARADALTLVSARP